MEEGDSALTDDILSEPFQDLDGKCLKVYGAEMRSAGWIDDGPFFESSYFQDSSRNMFKTIATDYMTLFEAFYSKRHPESSISQDVKEFLNVYVRSSCENFLCGGKLVEYVCDYCGKKFCGKCLFAFFIVHLDDGSFKCKSCPEIAVAPHVIAWGK
jgi:hypothetical protein